MRSNANIKEVENIKLYCITEDGNAVEVNVDTRGRAGLTISVDRYDNPTLTITTQFNNIEWVEPECNGIEPASSQELHEFLFTEA